MIACSWVMGLCQRRGFLLAGILGVAMVCLLAFPNQAMSYSLPKGVFLSPTSSPSSFRLSPQPFLKDSKASFATWRSSFTPSPEGDTSSADASGAGLFVGSVLLGIVDVVVIIVNSVAIGRRMPSLGAGIAGVVVSSLGIALDAIFLSLWSFFAIIPTVATLLVHVVGLVLGCVNIGWAVRSRAMGGAWSANDFVERVRPRAGGFAVSF